MCLALLLSSCSSLMEVEKSDRVSNEEFLALNAKIEYRGKRSDDFCFKKYADSGDAGILAWCESYVLNDLLDIYEYRPTKEIADQIWQHISWLKASFIENGSDGIRYRKVSGWFSKKYSKNKPTVWAVHNGMIASPIARFAWLVNGHGDIANAERGQVAFDLAVKAFDAMEQDWTSDGYVYPGHDLNGKKGVPLPYNMQAAMGMLAYYLYQADPRDKRYVGRMTTIARMINDAAYIDPRSGKAHLVWPYRGASGIEDSSHAFLTMGYLVRVYELGLVLDDKRFNLILSSFLDGAVGKGSKIRANLKGEKFASSFDSTCYRALVIYRHHRPTFDRCK
ncbi:hypothetical protein [uncultured Cohaesibacter sp.]|uniref:hypothetical protein n=1 Tax=uncultured Cohaesibacter sp. TaxID=1002546 RepID=UPI00292D4FBD|nr:hypothetical protein [uncultured Cohaesibacter sp.]